MRRTAPLVTSLLGLLGIAAPARAVDGVIEINQAAVFAGNITPGDTPGFPAVLNLPGSYRLTGSLDVTRQQNGSPQSDPQNVTAILVGAVDVTVDLNGFEIKGPVICAPCTPAGGSGKGVDASSSARATSVINGTIRGMGSDGVDLASGTVERVRAVMNGGRGIVVERGTVRDCFVESNGSDGIVSTLATVTGNTSRSNGGDGISATGSVVVQNVSSNNTEFGLSGNSDTGYSNNVFNGNNGGGAQVSPGPNEIPPGSNVCGSNTTCP